VGGLCSAISRWIALNDCGSASSTSDGWEGRGRNSSTFAFAPAERSVDRISTSSVPFHAMMAFWPALFTETSGSKARITTWPLSAYPGVPASPRKIMAAVKGESRAASTADGTRMIGLP
jgi:hypothetical protein